METIIAACCFCKNIRDGCPMGEGEAESWVTLQTYRAKYQLDERDLKLSHTYCPDCMKRYRHLLFSTTAASRALPLS
ncbi:MAG: hypothetical protein H8K10_07730 [Nitrospira sp.]|nr:hypothetical protein [Nitrospira sp.]